MPVTESRIKTGTLTFTVGGSPVDFSCQPTNVRITPAHDSDGDPLETLCGDVLGAEDTRTDTLNITAIQDFDDPDGFQAFSWDEDRTTVPFVWQPRGSTGPSYAGQVTVRALEIGGDVNKRLTVDASWPIGGPVVPPFPSP